MHATAPNIIGVVPPSGSGVEARGAYALAAVAAGAATGTMGAATAGAPIVPGKATFCAAGIACWETGVITGAATA